MVYETVLPPDTQNEIEEFLEERYVGHAATMQAVDEIEREIEKLAANPTLGAVPRGTPFETRRIHRFKVDVADNSRTVEFMYCVNKNRPSIVFSGFREIRLVL